MVPSSPLNKAKEFDTLCIVRMLLQLWWPRDIRKTKFYQRDLKQVFYYIGFRSRRETIISNFLLPIWNKTGLLCLFFTPFFSICLWKDATFPCNLCLVQSIPSKDQRVSGERFGISTVSLFFRTDCRDYFCMWFWTTASGQNGLFRIFGFHFSSDYLQLFQRSMWYFIHFQFAHVYRCVFHDVKDFERHWNTFGL